MLLPAILSISIVGVPFLIISLWYYFSLQHQQQKEPVFENANNIVIDQNGLANQPKCDDLEEKNQQIEFPSDEQVIICDDGIRRSIEPLKKGESLQQLYQELKQEIKPGISTIKCSQGIDKNNQTVTLSNQQQQKAQNIPSQEISKPQDSQQNSNTKDQTQKENTDPNEDQIIIVDDKKQNLQQIFQEYEPKKKQDYNHNLDNQEEIDNGKQAIKQSSSKQKTQNIQFPEQIPQHIQPNSQTVLNQHQKANHQIESDQQNSNGKDQTSQNQRLIEQAQLVPPIQNNIEPFSIQAIYVTNQVPHQKDNQITPKNPHSIIKEPKTSNIQFPEQIPLNIQTFSQTVLNQNQKANHQIKSDQQNFNGKDQTIQNQRLIEQAQQAPPIQNNAAPFSDSALNVTNQVLDQKDNQITPKNPHSFIKEPKTSNIKLPEQVPQQIQINSEDQIIIDDAKKQNQQQTFQNHEPKNQEETDKGKQAIDKSNQSSSKKKTLILTSKGDQEVEYPCNLDANENSKREQSTPGNQTTTPIPKNNHETPEGDPKENSLKSNQLFPIQGNGLQEQPLNKASLLTNQQTLPIKVIQNVHQDQTRLQPNYLQNQQNQQAVTIVTEQQSENDQRKNLKKYNRMQNIFLLISCIIFLQSIIGRIYVKNTKTKIEAPQFFILSAINAGFVIILYNFIYSGILCVMALCSVRAQEALIIARFCFVFYGLIMTFPIYAGLDDFITLDFITSIIAIIYSFIIQYPLMKIKVFCKWPTHIQFGTLQ